MFVPSLNNISNGKGLSVNILRIKLDYIHLRWYPVERTQSIPSARSIYETQIQNRSRKHGFPQTSLGLPILQCIAH